MENYVNRLLQEWIAYGKIIIGVDYDDTLRNWKMNTTETYEKVFDLLKAAQYTGAYIIVFTACKENRYDEISQYCKEHNLIIDGINKTPIEIEYGNSSKIYANVFLDDRAGLHESMKILSEAMYKYRGYQQGLKNNKLDDIA